MAGREKRGGGMKLERDKCSEPRDEGWRGFSAQSLLRHTESGWKLWMSAPLLPPLPTHHRRYVHIKRGWSSHEQLATVVSCAAPREIYGDDKSARRRWLKPNPEGFSEDSFSRTYTSCSQMNFENKWTLFKYVAIHESNIIWIGADPRMKVVLLTATVQKASNVYFVNTASLLYAACLSTAITSRDSHKLDDLHASPTIDCSSYFLVSPPRRQISGPSSLAPILMSASTVRKRNERRRGAHSRPPVVQSVGAPPIWGAGGSGFESRIMHGWPPGFCTSEARGDRDMHLNSLIAPTRKALNWHVVLPLITPLYETFSGNPTNNITRFEALTPALGISPACASSRSCCIICVHSGLFLHRHLRFTVPNTFGGTSQFLLLVGATVAERLTCSPSTMAIRVQSPAGSLRIFACRYSARRCRWSAGFLGDLPFPPPYSFQRCSILISVTLIGSQDLVVKSRTNLFTHSFSFQRIAYVLLRHVQKSTLPHTVFTINRALITRL
ncbi:hypothetical protein PR048_021856 [Dryococelus australis]|uniref:Uncharacterized protein n=1 Tax=Dryococelus australis TaxID=614101 RepID=A0ABQ9GZH0_9NEOP|nr:hypothetical protein PR048_021856 [Dryococelus australis]